MEGYRRLAYCDLCRRSAAVTPIDVKVDWRNLSFSPADTGDDFFTSFTAPWQLHVPFTIERHNTGSRRWLALRVCASTARDRRCDHRSGRFRRRRRRRRRKFTQARPPLACVPTACGPRGDGVHSLSIFRLCDDCKASRFPREAGGGGGGSMHGLCLMAHVISLRFLLLPVFFCVPEWTVV